MSFAKLDSGIVNSTLWVQPDDVLRVWIWLLSQSDQHGMVRVAAPALALVCMKPVDRIREILAILEAPDPDSRSSAEDGRRIRKVEGGWEIINYGGYRNRVSAEEKREADRVRIAEKRASDRESRDVSQLVASVAEVAQADTDTDTDKSKKQERVQPTAARSRFSDFWAVYPNHKARKDAEKAWAKRKLDSRCDELIAHVRLMAAGDDHWQRGFVPLGATYINGDRWEDVPKPAPEAQPRAGPSQPPKSQRLTAIETLMRGSPDAKSLAGTRDPSGLKPPGLLVP